MYKIIVGFVIVFLCVGFSSFDAGKNQKAEIVLCLDLSASTNGLLSDVRDNLWNFINTTRKSLPQTDLKIGVIVYARPSFGSSNDYVKVLSNITEDYDYISHQLFQMNVSIEKGDHCNGSAIYSAVKDISWSKEEGINKVIYLFGNGSVSMCGYDYRKACELASRKNIKINSVYCIQRSIATRELGGWNEIADLAKGEFYTYQITRRSPLKKVSGDAQWLVDLNNKLNDTYIYYTKEGKIQYELMLEADENSKRMNEQYFYSRCRYKFSPHYQTQCKKWDLVTQLEANSFEFSEFSNLELPKEYENVGMPKLLEIAKKKNQIRESLLLQMQNSYALLNIPLTFVNPLDSIFSHGISME